MNNEELRKKEKLKRKGSSQWASLKGPPKFIVSMSTVQFKGSSWASHPDIHIYSAREKIFMFSQICVFILVHYLKDIIEKVDFK